MTSEDGYPEMIDLVWYAVDRAGNLAGFATAGEGPIPLHLLTGNLAEEDAHEPTDRLPRITRPRGGALADMASSFADIAERGVFAYDWSDVHRIRGLLHAYELVAIPETPLKIHELPGNLRRKFEVTRFDRILFQDSKLLDIREYFAFKQGECCLSAPRAPAGR